MVLRNELSGLKRRVEAAFRKGDMRLVNSLISDFSAMCHVSGLWKEACLKAF